MVVVYHGRTEFDAQLARDVLLTAGIPVVHQPSLSTGILGVPVTTRVAVPGNAVPAALEALSEAGMEGAVEETPRGLAAFNDALAERFPLHRARGLPAGSRMRWVMTGILVLVLAIVLYVGFRG